MKNKSVFLFILISVMVPICAFGYYGPADDYGPTSPEFTLTPMSDTSSYYDSTPSAPILTPTPDDSSYYINDLYGGEVPTHTLMPSEDVEDQAGDFLESTLEQSVKEIFMQIENADKENMAEVLAAAKKKLEELYLKYLNEIENGDLENSDLYYLDSLISELEENIKWMQRELGMPNPEKIEFDTEGSLNKKLCRIIENTPGEVEKIIMSIITAVKKGGDVPKWGFFRLDHLKVKYNFALQAKGFEPFASIPVSETFYETLKAKNAKLISAVQKEINALEAAIPFSPSKEALEDLEKEIDNLHEKIKKYKVGVNRQVNLIISLVSPVKDLKCE